MLTNPYTIKLKNMQQQIYSYNLVINKQYTYRCNVLHFYVQEWNVMSAL